MRDHIKNSFKPRREIYKAYYEAQKLLCLTGEDEIHEFGNKKQGKKQIYACEENSK